MRNDAMTRATTKDIERVQGYHEGGHFAGEAYAFQGFKSNKYFTSDRYMKLDDHFRRADGKPLQGYGLEIETETWGVTTSAAYAELLQKIVFASMPEDLFKLQRDGSLSSGSCSAQAITQVMTREFIRNHYADWKLIFDTYFPAFQISCTRSGNCGMHVNISRSCFGKTQAVQDDGIRKLLYFVNHHYGLACSLFRRDPRHTHWCGVMSQYTTKDACKNADLHNMSSSHGNCFNGSHYDAGRVELRLVGGQEKFAAFRNTVETIFFLVGRLSKVSWSKMDDIAYIFRGCNQYVYDRLTLARREGYLAPTMEQADAICDDVLTYVVREQMI